MYLEEIIGKQVFEDLTHEFKARLERKLQNSNTTSKDESLCNAIDNALNLLIEADLVL